MLLIMVAGDDNAAPRAEPTPTELRAVIDAHYQAIEENRHELAMGSYHSQAPGIATIKSELKFTMSSQFQTTATLSFYTNGTESGDVVVHATHRYLIISGLKLVTCFSDTAYHFREELGEWKIWSKHEYQSQLPRRNLARS